MSRRPIQSFRGWHAAMLLPPGRNRDVLQETLERLGVLPVVLEPGAAEPDSAEPAPRLLVVDNDVPEATQAAAALTRERSLPIVVVIGLETPSRLQRALDLEPHAMLLKPIRATGVYSALYVAVNGHRLHDARRERIAELEQRHAGRRLVTRAVLALMQRHGCSDDQAYRILRKESMRQRVTVEALAARLGAEPPHAPALRVRDA
jgi:AmiR/NasT family two-component response regulator